jgi:hypothetical protein
VLTTQTEAGESMGRYDTEENGFFFRHEGCVLWQTRQQLREECSTKGFCSFLLYNWVDGQSSILQERDGRRRQQQGLVDTNMMRAYIRYLNYVLVPFAQREQLHVKSSFYIFLSGLLYKFTVGGLYYVRNNLPCAHMLLQKDFWLFPNEHKNNHWSLVVICYPSLKGKTYLAVLDSQSASMTLEAQAIQAFVLNVRTFFVNEHLLASNKQYCDPTFDSSLEKKKIVWINVPQQEKNCNDGGNYVM